MRIYVCNLNLLIGSLAIMQLTIICALIWLGEVLKMIKTHYEWDEVNEQFTRYKWNEEVAELESNE